MARRSVSWSEGLSNDLKDPEFAAEFITGLMEEGESLKDALALTIKAYGVTEFADLVKLKESNIHRVLSDGSNPTGATYERLLKPFGLNLGIRRSQKSAG